MHINGVDIRTNARGFISTKDLKAASGLTSERNKNFAYWRKQAGTESLLEEIRSSVGYRDIVEYETSHMAFVHESVMWAYAAFLSDSFHAQLLAVFGAARRGEALEAVVAANNAVAEVMETEATTTEVKSSGTRLIIQPTSVPVTIDIYSI